MQRVHIEAFDLNLLLAFDALWTERHVTRAARRVGLTQSAMSHALGRLRRSSRIRCFSATPRGLSPTARAHALAPSIAEALAIVRRAVALDAALLAGDAAAHVHHRHHRLRRARASAARCLTRLCARRPACSSSCAPPPASASASSLSGAQDLVLGVGAPDGDGLRSELLFSGSHRVALARRPSGGAAAADAASASSRCRTCSCRRRGTATPPSTWRCARAS